MDNCYSADHTAEDHMHTDVTCKIVRNHNRSTALERSAVEYFGA